MGSKALGAAHVDRGLRLAGVGAILGAALLRAMVTHAPMPFWDVDPRVTPIPISDGPRTGWLLLDVLGAPLTGLGPSGSMLLDAMALLGATIAMLGVRAARHPIRWWSIGLALAGSLVALAHGAVVHGGSLDHLYRASAWIAAIWSGLAVWHASRDRGVRRLAVGLLLGFGVMLAFKGMLQIAIEHPATLELFHANKSEQLASRGWEPGSAAARLYERRLTQAEASGWFGLANVYATFMAGLLVALVGLGIAWAWHKRRLDLASSSILMLGLACGAGLVLSGSKAGLGAAAIGLGCGLLVILRRTLGSRRGWTPMRARTGSVLALVAIAIPLLAVGVRGVIGTRLDELSLLFRSYYLRGAVRVIADHPLIGVGPGGFQSGYLRARPPLSPEEVDSPHSVFFDWLATLGLGGLAWSALLTGALWLGGRSLVPSGLGDRDRAVGAAPEPDAVRPKTRLYWLAGAGLVSSVLALVLERGASPPLLIASAISSAEPVPIPAVLLGLAITLGMVGAWIAAAWAIASRPLTGLTGLALAGGAIALVVHAQLDMAPVRIGSASLLLVMIGALLGDGDEQAAPIGHDPRASDPARAVEEGPRRSGRAGRWRWRIAAGAAPGLLAGWLVIAGLLPTLEWERGVIRAARIAEPVGSLASSIRQLEATRLTPGERRRRLTPIIDQLRELTGEPPARDASQLRDQLARARHAVIEPVVEAFERALDASGLHDTGTSTRIVRLCIEAAGGSRLERADRIRWLDRADRHASSLIARVPHDPSGWSALAEVEHARWKLLGDAAAADRAGAALERLIDLNPYGLGPVRRRMALAEARGRDDEAARWARRLLELDDLKRLDPARRLTNSERSRASRLAEIP